MLFDELDIERQLAPDWAESKLYCSAKQICPDGSETITMGLGIKGCMAFDASGQRLRPVYVPNHWKKGDSIPSYAAGDSAGKEAAEKEDAAYVAKVDQLRREGATLGQAQAGISPKAQAAERKARWQDQCFLIEGWKEITKKYQNCVGDKQVSGYKHVLPVIGESADVVSILGNRANANLFFNLSSAQLSMLVPTIRLFIVRYTQEKSPAGKKIIRPEDEPLELYLDDHTGKNIVDSIMSGKIGRAEAVGLESFTYEFDGKDPKTKDTLIKASLDLVLNSFGALTREQDNGAKFLDLMLRPTKMVNNTRYARDIAKEGDNFYNWCKEAESDDNAFDSEMSFNPMYRRIKASVGWAIPPGDLFFELFPAELRAQVKGDFRSKMTALLQDLQLNLFLEMTDYDLDFRNDGKVNLTINYRAAVEGELSEPEANIFYLMVNETAKHNKDAENKIAAAKSAGEAAAKAAKEGSDQQKASQKAASDNYKYVNLQQQKRAASLIHSSKLFWYSKFLDTLESTGRIIAINLDKEAIKLWRGNRDFAAPDSETAEVAADRIGLSANEILKDIFAGETEYGEAYMVDDGMDESFQGGAEIPTGIAAQALKDASAEAVRLRAALERSSQSGDGDVFGAPDGGAYDPRKANDIVQNAALRPQGGVGKRSIYFTFLGDILDTAMMFVADLNVRSSFKESTIRLITSQVNFRDPGATAKDAERASLNIADIPIALGEFNTWFHNNVTKKGRTYYPVIQFIEDVMTNLVFQAFGYNCIGGSDRTVPILNYTHFDAPKINGKDPLRRGIRYNSLKPLRDIQKIMPFSKTKSPKDVVNYLILHGSARSFVDKNAGNIDQDERDGIYHFGLGLDKGILKEIKFSAKSLKYQTEARVVEQGASGIEELFRKFDATVEMYGCPIFRNGQYLYLDPRTMGVSSDIARAIGLGGYYTIYNVSGELSREGYTMTLQTNFQGSGLCKDQTRDASSQLCPVSVLNLDKFVPQESQNVAEMEAASAAAIKSGEVTNLLGPGSPTGPGAGAPATVEEEVAPGPVPGPSKE